MEEERPVDVASKRLDLRLDGANAGERRHGQVLVAPDDRRAVRARPGQRQQRLPLTLAVELAQPVLVDAVLRIERRAALRVEQVPNHADDPRRVEDVHRRLAVLGRDADRRVLPRCRRAADQERQRQPAPFHLAGDADHLVERRRDQPREADDVHVLLDRGVEDPVGRNHDAEIDDLVVVAAEDDADDVLADVVHVTLDGGQHDFALRAARALALRPP